MTGLRNMASDGERFWQKHMQSFPNNNKTSVGIDHGSSLPSTLFWCTSFKLQLEAANDLHLKILSSEAESSGWSMTCIHLGCAKAAVPMRFGD